jgi:1-acyl-sn-glycerol-3-phosphate acyltransferase
LYDAAPAGARFPRPRKVQVRFGAPLTFPAVAGRAPSAAELRMWTDELMSAIQALSGQDRSPADGIAPL